MNKITYTSIILSLSLFILFLSCQKESTVSISEETVSAKETVPDNEIIFYSYHNKTPYYIHSSDTENILNNFIYTNVAKYLNNKQTKYNVKIKYMPRIRLETELNNKTLNGAIIGVHQNWFSDREMEKYLWTEPFMVDKDVVIVKKGNSFVYRGPNDLIGKHLSIPRGLYFWGVSELINDGKIKADITNSDLQNFQMVAAGRCDATISSHLTFIQLTNEYFQNDELEYLETPHDSFDRKILFPKELEREYKFFKPIFEKILSDAEWITTLKSFY